MKRLVVWESAHAVGALGLFFGAFYALGFDRLELKLLNSYLALLLFTIASLWSIAFSGLVAILGEGEMRLSSQVAALALLLAYAVSSSLLALELEVPFTNWLVLAMISIAVIALVFMCLDITEKMLSRSLQSYQHYGRKVVYLSVLWEISVIVLPIVWRVVV